MKSWSAQGLHLLLLKARFTFLLFCHRRKTYSDTGEPLELSELYGTFHRIISLQCGARQWISGKFNCALCRNCASKPSVFPTYQWLKRFRIISDLSQDLVSYLDSIFRHHRVQYMSMMFKTLSRYHIYQFFTNTFTKACKCYHCYTQTIEACHLYQTILYGNHL